MRTREGNQLLTIAVDAKDDELVEILSPKTIDNVDSTGYTALYRCVHVDIRIYLPIWNLGGGDGLIS